MLLLRQSTAVKVHVGPIVTAAAQGTPVTNAALAANEALLFKAGATSGVDLAARPWSHIVGGIYQIDLTASDTDTLGQFTLTVQDASSLAHVIRGMVVGAQTFDSLLGSDRLQVDIREIAGTSAAADALSNGAQALVTGTVGVGSTTTRIVTDLSEATNDHYNGRTITFLSGVLQGAATSIDDYNGTTKEITCPDLTDAPASGDRFVIA
jgi:hypothetical protein